MWVRGLKPQVRDFVGCDPVAPYVGAWIETLRCALAFLSRVVAPYVGAWIETRVAIPRAWRLYWVAPYVGAWIETV